MRSRFSPMTSDSAMVPTLFFQDENRLCVRYNAAALIRRSLI